MVLTTLVEAFNHCNVIDRLCLVRPIIFPSRQTFDIDRLTKDTILVPFCALSIGLQAEIFMPRPIFRTNMYLFPARG